MTENQKLSAVRGTRFGPPSSRPGQGSESGLSSLRFDDYVPSIRPWMSFSSLTLVLGFFSALFFMAVFPYRVVVRGTGIIRPAGELSVINSPFDGRLKSIDVSSNQKVEAGQVVVTLDKTDLIGKLRESQQSIEQIRKQSQSLVAQSQAEHDVALSEIKKSKSELKLAKSEYQRFLALRDSGAASMQQVEEREASYNIAQATLEKSVTALTELMSRNDNQKAQLQRELVAQEAIGLKITRDLGQSEIRSPVSGYVQNLAVRSPGQTIGVGQPIASIAPSQVALLVKATIKGEDIANVKVGQPAIIRVDGCPHPDFGVLRAKVSTIAPDSISQEKVSTSQNPDTSVPSSSGGYEVRLIPEKTVMTNSLRRCQLKIGMDLSVDIATRNEPILVFLLRRARIITGG